jgi:hypothetical protein
MKNLILLLSLVFSLNAFSQVDKPITKGNIMLSGGGTISYSKIKSEYSSSSSNNSLFSISLTPGFSYFIIDNLAIGLNVTMGYNGAKNNQFYTLGVGPLVKYYFNNGLFLNAEIGYNYTRGINHTDGVIKFFSLKPGVGYAFFLNQKVSLEPSISYEFRNIKTDNIDISMINKVNNIMLELKFNIFL